ncbi:MAG: LemA family protein [Clostridia bacterium]|nr:LemA family protein [Clostridia bacterium]
MKRSGLFALIVVLVVIVLLGASYVSISNSMVTSEENVNGAWAEVQNQLQRRYDLIPNLVETVKGYAAHEEGVFSAIAEARAKMGGARTVEETNEAVGQMEGALSRLLMVVENYPQLKADAAFKDLMYELAGTENRIAVARQRYNGAVQSFNVKIRTFPNSIVAGMKGLTPKTMFEAQPGATTAPQVKF